MADPVCPECRQPVTAHRTGCRQPRTKDDLLRALGGDMGAMQDPEVKRLLAALPECGGCAGMGSHRKWCENVVGRSAHMLGKWSQAAESLGDSVGPNEMGAANHLWAAAGLLRVEAKKRADEWRARENGSDYTDE